MNAIKHLWKKINPRRPGQAMVEFALILPLLLLLLFGIIEVGRLMVIYSSVQAASREGARYGSAAGLAPNGQPYYLDEAGIRAEAERIAILANVADVEVDYDHGPSTTNFSPASAIDVSLRDRVIVTVSAQYEPFLGMTPLNAFLIEATTSRTIFKEVPVAGFSDGTGTGTGTNTPPNVIITGPNNGSSVTYKEGTPINFTATATDPEDGDVCGSVIWTATKVGAPNDGSVTSLGNTCNPPAFSSLAPGLYNVRALATDSEGESASDDMTVLIEPQYPPVLSVSSPLVGQTYETGQPINFQATALDPEDGDISANITWTSSKDGALGTGSSFSLSTLSAGSHTITVIIVDSYGLSDQVVITLAVVANAPPDVNITGPADGSATLPHNKPIQFTATAIDPPATDLGASLQWTFSDGATGVGSSPLHAFATTGTHWARAEVSDAEGNLGWDQITFTIVPNQPPVVTIIAPTIISATTGFFEGTAIQFTATAIDAEDTPTDRSSTLVWYDTISGSEVQIGTGPSFTKSNLSVGTHPLIVRATDSAGLVGAGTISVVVKALNTAPTITINSVTTANSDMGFKDSKPIVFTGTANDTEEGTISYKINWFASTDGSTWIPFGVGGSVGIITSTLASDTYTIKATVTDLLGLSASAIWPQSIYVKEAVCPQQPTASWVVDSGNVYKGVQITYQVTDISETMKLLRLDSKVLTVASNITAISVDGITVTGIVPSTQVVVTTPYLATPDSAGKFIIYISVSPSIKKNTGTIDVTAVFDGCTLPSVIVTGPN